MGPVSTRTRPAALALRFAAGVGGCTPAGSPSSGAALDQAGRPIRIEQVREPAMAHPINVAAAITTGNQSYFQQDAPATAWEQVPVKAPGGSEVDVVSD